MSRKCRVEISKMAEVALLRKSAEDTVGMTLIATHKAMSSGQIKSGSGVSKRRRHPGLLAVTFPTRAAERVHMRVSVTGGAVGPEGAHIFRNIMAGRTLQPIVNSS